MRFLMMAVASAALLSTAGPPSASAQTQPDALAVSGAGDQRPGGLTAHDVVGKHLNDADGNELGQIVGVSPDGMSAEVRPMHGGSPMTVGMAELSLGTGARTVIKGEVPPSNTPNWSRQSTTITSTTTPSPVVVVPPPQ
jgi:hypothetical protein